MCNCIHFSLSFTFHTADVAFDCIDVHMMLSLQQVSKFTLTEVHIER